MQTTHKHLPLRTYKVWFCVCMWIMVPFSEPLRVLWISTFGTSISHTMTSELEEAEGWLPLLWPSPAPSVQPLSTESILFTSEPGHANTHTLKLTLTKLLVKYTEKIGVHFHKALGKRRLQTSARLFQQLSLTKTDIE